MKISANKFLDDCHPSTEWRKKKIPASEKPVDGSFFLFPDAVHRAICRSEDCGASVTKAFWEGNPWLVYFQEPSQLYFFVGTKLTIFSGIVKFFL